MGTVARRLIPYDDLLPSDASAVSEANGTTVPVSLAREFAFDTAARRKPLAGAADAVYGNSIDFRLKIIARSGIRQKRCY